MCLFASMQSIKSLILVAQLLERWCDSLVAQVRILAVPFTVTLQGGTHLAAAYINYLVL